MLMATDVSMMKRSPHAKIAALPDRPKNLLRLPEDLADGLYRPGVLHPVARQLRYCGVKLLRAHDRQPPLDGLDFEDLLLADEEIVLGQHPHEIEPELPCGR